MKIITRAMEDPKLFGASFKRRLLRGDTFARWKTFLRALFALPMSDADREVYREHTGRTDAPAEPFREAFCVVGRRGGKSLIAALVAVYLATFKNYDDVLAPGEVGTLMILAADRRQARVIFGYVVALLESSPMLRSMVESKLKESITLTNRVVIEIHTCSFKATRGYTLIGVIADELAFWNSDDSANPDVEVLNALRPGLATTNGLLLGISSPYAKRGALYSAFRENFGKNESSVLIWKSDSRSMNPTLPRSVVAAAYARDAASAKAEFGGEFRDDVSAFVSAELVERSVIPGRKELPPLPGVNYCAFADPSGGSSDSYTLAIGHLGQNSEVVLDLLRERPAPFSPEEVTTEFAAELKRVHISTVVGDRYAGGWPREQFSKRGISYKIAELTRSELYLEMLPLLTSGTVQLLDHPKLKTQLANLERRTARSGKDSIDHPPGGHDDCANAVAGVLVELARGAALTLGWIEYLKGVSSGEIACPDIQLKPAKIPAAPPSCPKCGGPRVLIGGVGLRCNQCAAVLTNEEDNEPVAAAPAQGPCCGNPLPQTIGGGGVRCGNCGRQTNAPVPVVGMSRRQYLTATTRFGRFGI